MQLPLSPDVGDISTSDLIRRRHIKLPIQGVRDVRPLSLYGVNPRVEVSGGTGKDRWKADVYFEIGDRKIAIELQRSYQHLRDFVRR